MNFIFSDNVHILYLFCDVKNPKQLPNCLKRTETNIILIVFMVSSVKSALILLPFLTITQHKYNLTAQIEQVQDKYM